MTYTYRVCVCLLWVCVGGTWWTQNGFKSAHCEPKNILNTSCWVELARITTGFHLSASEPLWSGTYGWMTATVYKLQGSFWVWHQPSWDLFLISAAQIQSPDRQMRTINRPGDPECHHGWSGGRLINLSILNSEFYHYFLKKLTVLWKCEKCRLQYGGDFIQASVC